MGREVGRCDRAGRAAHLHDDIRALNFGEALTAQFCATKSSMIFTTSKTRAWTPQFWGVESPMISTGRILSRALGTFLCSVGVKDIVLPRLHGHGLGLGREAGDLDGAADVVAAGLFGLAFDGEFPGGETDATFVPTTARKWANLARFLPRQLHPFRYQLGPLLDGQFGAVKVLADFANNPGLISAPWRSQAPPAMRRSSGGASPLHGHPGASSWVQGVFVGVASPVQAPAGIVGPPWTCFR